MRDSGISAPRDDRVDSTIGPGTEIKGNLLVKGSIRIDGKTEGTVSADGNVIVGKKGDLHANIKASNIIVSGRITGDIKANTRVELQAGGQVFGNIDTPSLIVSEGVIFEGNCRMGKQKGPPPEKSEERKSPIIPPEDKKSS